MKVGLQLASALPALAKAGLPGSQDKGAFGTAMQEKMEGGTPSGTGLLDVTVPGRPPKQSQPQLEEHLETGKSDRSTDGLAIEVQVAAQRVRNGVPFGLPQQDAIQNELLKGRTAHSSNEERSPAPKEVCSAQVMKVLSGEEPIIQRTVVGKLPRVMSGEGYEHVEPAVRGEKPHPSLPANAPSRTRSETKTIRDKRIHSANGLSSPVQLTQVLSADPLPNLVVPMSAQQSNEARQAPSEAYSNDTHDHAHDGGESHRRSVSPIAPNHVDPHGAQFVPSKPSMTTDVSTVAAGATGRFLHVPRSTANPAHSTDTAPAPLRNENASVGAIPAAREASRPRAAHPVDGVEVKAPPADAHTLKESEKKIATEMKPEMMATIPGYSTAAEVPTPQPGAQNLAPAVPQGTEKAMEAHRPEGSAAHVLQRMDMGVSSGTMQLRADARRLDVGVSSSDLGWVEVRATSGPSGRIDASLHVQNDVSAHLLSSQSKEISDFAREQSVPLGQLSVGVGTGDRERGGSHPAPDRTRDESETQTRGTARTPANQEGIYHLTDTVSFISIRA
jgi:hypothetical protein